MFTKRGWRGWIWVFVIAGLIFLASSRSQVAAPEIKYIDKITHFAVFGLLATLVARNGFVPRFGWLAVVIASAYGMTDEWHQSFTPGRSVEFADWVADTLGAMVAVGLYSYWERYRRFLERPLGRSQTRIENRA